MERNLGRPLKIAKSVWICADSPAAITNSKLARFMGTYRNYLSVSPL